MSAGRLTGSNAKWETRGVSVAVVVVEKRCLIDEAFLANSEARVAEALYIQRALINARWCEKLSCFVCARSVAIVHRIKSSNVMLQWREKKVYSKYHNALLKARGMVRGERNGGTNNYMRLRSWKISREKRRRCLKLGVRRWRAAGEIYGREVWAEEEIEEKCAKHYRAKILMSMAYKEIYCMSGYAEINNNVSTSWNQASILSRYNIMKRELKSKQNALQFFCCGKCWWYALAKWRREGKIEVIVNYFSGYRMAFLWNILLWH